MVDKNESNMDGEHIMRHDFLNYCSCCLLDIIKYVDENHIAKENLHFNDKRLADEFQSKCATLTEDEKTSWLINNGCKNDIYNFYYKHLFCSLIVDFSNYYNASVEMAYKRNIYAAWALLRRPLQETLAYLEWLYVDRYELIKLMLEQDDTKKYELMSRVNKSKIKNHIQEIQAEGEKGIIDLYEFRYSYDTEFTINGILQATNHLITTRPALKTSPHGLNFVFQNDDTINRNTGFYYTSVPYIMLNAMKIIFGMFFEIANLDEYSQNINYLNLSLKNFGAMPIEFEKSKEILQLSDRKIICPHCKKGYSTNEKWIDFTNNRFKCDKCFTELDTFGFIPDYMLNRTEENKNE